MDEDENNEEEKKDLFRKNIPRRLDPLPLKKHESLIESLQRAGKQTSDEKTV